MFSAQTAKSFSITAPQKAACLFLQRSGSYLRVCNQGVNVLNRQARIGAVKPDGWKIVGLGPVKERLGILRHRGWRRSNDKFKKSVENWSEFHREVLDVLMERTVEDCKEG